MAVVSIDSSGTASIHGSNIAADREVISLALERLAAWLRSHHDD